MGECARAAETLFGMFGERNGYDLFHCLREMRDLISQEGWRHNCVLSQDLQY
jgi:hypothetical protein